MKTLTLLTFLLFSTVLYCQTFEKVYYNSSEIHPQSIVHDDKNGIVIAGRHDANGMIFRIDEQGEIIWQTGFENPVNLYPQIDFFEIVAVADSNFIVAGLVSNINTNKLNCLLLKVDKNGDLVWHKEYDNSSMHSITHSSVVEMADSGYLIAWGSYNNGNGWSMSRTDINGNLMWSKSYTSAQSVLISDIEKLTDSTFVVLGNVNESGAPYYSGIITTIDDDGNVLTTKKYPGMLFDDAAINGNTMALCGKNSASGFYQFYTIADHQGNFTWNRTPGWGNGSNMIDTYSQVIRRNDSSYVVYIAVDMWSGNAHAFDLGGNLTNSLTLHPISADLMPAEDGGVLFVGSGPLYGIKYLTTEHIGAIKVDSAFTTSNCAWSDPLSQSELFMPQVDTFIFTPAGTPTSENVDVFQMQVSLLDSNRCIEMLGSINENDLELNVSVYPTVTSDQITIEFYDLNQLSMTLYTSDGEMVQQIDAVYSKEQISLGHLSNGVYLFTVQSEDGRQKNGRIVLNK